MTDLISTPPLPASPQGSKVITGAWWPDIDVNKVRDTLNLGGTTITHDRLVAAIEFGISEVTRELATWRLEQVAAGKATLAAVDPEDTINGEPIAVMQFTRAVRLMAAAELADRHKDIIIARPGAERAEERACMADDFRRDATRAIRAMTGETGTLVDLV